MKLPIKVDVYISITMMNYGRWGEIYIIGQNWAVNFLSLKYCSGCVYLFLFFYLFIRANEFAIQAQNKIFKYCSVENGVPVLFFEYFPV